MPKRVNIAEAPAADVLPNLEPAPGVASRQSRAASLIIPPSPCAYRLSIAWTALSFARTPRSTGLVAELSTDGQSGVRPSATASATSVTRWGFESCRRRHRIAHQ